MKIIYILLIGVGLSLNINAQQETKQKEIGICISNLDHFGFTFKSETNKSLWRFQSLLLSGSNYTIELDTLLTKSKSLGIHIRLGKEHRKNINDNLQFRYGGDISFGYSESTYDSKSKLKSNTGQYREIVTYNPGINLILGFNYLIGEKFILGAEFLPGVSYKIGEIKNIETIDRYSLL